MPDICMCRGGGCPVRGACWRYLARPSERQGYFQETPFIERNCEHFWPVNWDEKEKPYPVTRKEFDDETCN